MATIAISEKRAAELVHVADVREAQSASPTIVATPLPPPAPSPTWVLTLNPSLLYFGGYFSNNFFNTGGASVRVGVEHGPQRPGSPAWQWAPTGDATVFGAPDRNATRQASWRFCSAAVRCSRCRSALAAASAPSRTPRTRR